MRRDIEVQNPAASVLDDEETVQHTEGHGRHGEEVQGNDRLAVIVKKSQPFLGRITPALDSPQVARNGPLREHEAELLQFAMDFRRAPVGVLLRQAPNQDTNFLGDLRPAATRPRFPTPIKPKSSPMPTDDRFRFDKRNANPSSETNAPAGLSRRADPGGATVAETVSASERPLGGESARTSTAMSVRLWKKTRAAAIRARTTGSMDYPFLPRSKGQLPH